MTDRPIIIDVHLAAGWWRQALVADITAGLTCEPKDLPPKWFYDERGSQLFDEITRLDEYYPTRCETEILEARAADIAARSGAEVLVELGSGTSAKTRILLEALAGAGTATRFVPFDVSEETLRTAAAAIHHEYPQLEVHGVVGDFDHHLHLLPAGGPRLVAFLGGTIGNFEPNARKEFLSELAGGLEPGDSLLLGTDLVKDPDRLVAAYDDAAGITAEFNRNVLHVINRELHADFNIDRFEHVAAWDSDAEWIEMRLRSLDDTTVTLADLGLEITFDKGEEMRTEISAKFRRSGVEAELAAAGLEPECWWTDRNGEFALSLSFVR